MLLELVLQRGRRAEVGAGEAVQLVTGRAQDRALGPATHRGAGQSVTLRTELTVHSPPAQYNRRQLTQQKRSQRAHHYNQELEEENTPVFTRQSENHGVLSKYRVSQKFFFNTYHLSVRASPIALCPLG